MTLFLGMGPDYRLLVKRARKMAQQYQLMYDEPIPTAQLVQRIAMVMQEYTQSGYVLVLYSTVSSLCFCEFVLRCYNPFYYNNIVFLLFFLQWC